MAAKKPEATIRALLRQQLPPEEIVPLMVKSVKDGLASTETKWVECSHCHKKTANVIPNFYERVKVAQTLISELEGKIGTHREAPSEARATVGDLDELSDDALLALLTATEPEPEPEEEENGDTDGD